MGGTIALVAADRAPERFSGLLLLDPVIVADRQLLPMRLMGARRRASMPMVRSALKRPERFDSLAAAFDFYRPKRAFAGLDDAALWDYVRASKVECEDGGVALRFPAAWEAAIYQSVPRVKPQLKRLRIPTLGLRGRDSGTLLPPVWRRWSHWQPQAVLRECPGGHLFPLEQPRAAAAPIIEFLSTLQ
jgi:pimeloyl-ACP methyl ester carboxylesterase